MISLDLGPGRGFGSFGTTGLLRKTVNVNKITLSCRERVNRTARSYRTALAARVQWLAEERTTAQRK